MKTRYFPWRLFRKFFLSLVLILNSIFILFLGLASYAFDFYFYRGPTFLFVLAYFAVSILISAIFSYRFSLPLRRVILKALRIANKKQAQGFFDQDNEDLHEAEPGEYFELEQALDKIRKKYKKRRVELSHEREEIQALMSSLQDAVISIKEDGKFGYFNSRFATLFLGPDQLKNHLDGSSPLSLTNVFRDPQILEKINRSFQSGLVERFQTRIPTFLESIGRHFSLTISPLREEKTRHIYGAIVLFHDISDFKVSEKIRIEFVENASHELRTPLTSMKGFLDTAKEDIQNKKFEQVPYFLDVVSKGIDRMTALVNDMLTISSLENKAGLSFELIQPEVLTQEVFEELSPLASDKKIMLKMTDESGPFRADLSLLNRLLVNLVENAIKYIQEGGRIEVTWHLSADRKIQLKVSDNGPGISEEHHERLFERFYRIDKGRNRDVGGTGLGLAIVKHVMQTHGGTVEIKSQVGHGAMFICEFPYRT